jgi:valyl-tRNA synthetase
VTEEVWSWWREGSVHQTRWPRSDEIPAGPGDEAAEASAALQHAREVTAMIRHQRSSRKWGFRKAVRATFVLAESRRPYWKSIERDILAGNNVAGHAVTFDPTRDDVRIELADES